MNENKGFPGSEKIQEIEVLNQDNILKSFFPSFWHFRTESGLRLCQLHRSKGRRESHQHIKWTQTSDQNNQGN